MAMDSYIKGVVGSQQVIPAKSAGSGQKALVSDSSVQNASMQENKGVVKKASETENTAKKTSVPKSSRKASAPKSSSKRNVVPKSSTKKVSVPKNSAKKAVVSTNSSVKRASVSGSSISKPNKTQVQKIDKAQTTDYVPKTTETVEENMEALFTMEKEPSISTIDSAVSMMNAQMAKTTCAYSYDEDTRRVTIKMYDDDTGELIREVPPEKSLEALKRIWEMAGIMVDEKF